MKTIVIPVDFSPSSLNAVNYSMDLAFGIRASVTLVHVCQFPVSMNEVPVSAQVYAGILEDAHAQMRKLKKELEHRYKIGNPVKIYTEVREGNVISQVEELCAALKPFAVIMGAHGTGAMERFLFGSNTLSAIKHLTWPLMIVPRGVKFTSIRRIGLACDLKKVIESVHAEEIKKIVTEFHAQLHVLNVNSEPGKKLPAEQIEASAWLQTMLDEVKPEFHFLNNEDIDGALNEFAEKNNLDLLIVVPKKHNVLEALFHNSHSKQTALRTHIPIMAIHE